MSSPRFVAPTLILVGLALLANGCKRPQSAALQQPPPPTVTIAPPTEREFTDEVELSARIEPVETVEIRPRVSGYLSDVRFKAGQRVEKGDLLFAIDSRPFQAVLQRAEADLAQARARAESAQRDERRATTLEEQKAISKEEADQRRSRLSESRAAVASAEASVTTARLNLEYTEVRSPIRGRISRAFVTQGNNISGVDGFTTLLATVVTDDPVHVYADLDEATLHRVQALRAAGKVGTDPAGRLPVRLTLPNDPGLDRTGFVESFNNRIDADTGSLLIRAEVGNADGTLIPGQFVRLRVPVSSRSRVLMVPEVAIGTDLAQRFVLTVSYSNTVDYQAVTLGAAVDGYRVVREGLRGGERVIVNGIARVRPGMPVEPVRSTNAAAARPPGA
jgi:multidrug efflux system membrane fusion protein